MHRRTASWLVATLLVLALGASPAAAVPLVQLGFLVDGSGSITPGNFETIKTGIANAFQNVLPTDGSVEVTVVRFDTTASVVVSPTVIDSAMALDAVVSAIGGMSYFGGWTNMPEAIDLLTGQVQSSAVYGAAPIVYNMVTDGLPVLNGMDLTAQTVAARDAAVGAGLDEFDVEFIGSTLSPGYSFLLNELVYPQPGHSAPPYTPGFVVPVTFDNFEQAFESKLIAVTNPVPEPGTLLLLGAGLLGLGARVRRRRP